MAKIEVQILDYDNGVLGTLDITDSENFPLAISYLISDGRDLESRFGDFSKSFDVPATKNNNKLFDNIYNAKIDDVKDIVGLKDCRILVDSVDFFKGKIQVKGNKQSSKPLSYSCTIFGGNYGWLSQIKNKNVCDTFDRYGELIVNGSFGVQVASGVSGGDWTFGGAGLLWGNGVITFYGITYKELDQDVLSINQKLAVGEKYEVSFEITSYTSGSLGGSVTNSAGDTSVWTGADSVGVWSYQFIFGDAGTGTNLSTFRLNSEAGGFIGALSNVSLRSIKTIEYTKDNIISSWTDTQATNDIVYPVIDYGKWDSDWGGAWISGYNNSLSETKDMRPSWYLYNLFHNIFDNVGYNVSSNFIEDSDFKKLICHFPPDVDKLTQLRPPEVMISRDYWNQDSPTGGSKAIWDNTITSTDYQILVASDSKTINSSSDTDTGWKVIKNDLTVSDINGDYDSSTGVWTCAIGGRYSFNSVAELIIGNFENDQLGAEQYATCRLNVYMGIFMKTAGGSSFNVPLAVTSNDNSKVGAWDYNNYIGTHATSASSPQYPSTKVPLLNAVSVGISSELTLDTGDEIRVEVKVKARAGSSPSNNVRWGVAAVNDNFRTTLTGTSGTADYMIFPSIPPPGGGWFYMNSNVDNAVNMWELYETPYFKITPLSEDYEWGETYKYSDLLPCNVSQVNFIKGVAHLFNLQFRTDATTKTVYIEPFNDFYQDKSLSYDWTDKLDLSKEIEDDYNIGLSDKLSFQYKNDGSDGLMKYINKSFKEGGNEYNFFNYFEELGEGYKKGMTKFENPVFSSTWCDWDPAIKDGNPPLVPVINKEESLYGWSLWYISRHLVERPDKIYKYNPRILLYQGYVESPNATNLMTGWTYWDGFNSRVYDTETPRATFVDWDNDSGNKFTNLSYNDEIITPPTTSTSTTVEGLYSIYWKKMIDQLKANPRIRVMFLNLNSSDIATLNLSKLAYINGTYWRINKIVDYSPLKNTTTKVEFIQWI